MDLKKKQKALRMISNGMYVVTSRSGLKYGGATITWLTQASFRPPLIMAAIQNGSGVLQCLVESKEAVVHILNERQLDIARKFLSTPKLREGMMNGEPIMEGRTSAPVLRNVSSYLECRVRQILETGGDHSLVVMEVIHAEHVEDLKPLLVANSPWRYGG